MCSAERVPDRVLFEILVPSKILLPISELLLAQEESIRPLAEEVFALADEGLRWFCREENEREGEAVPLWKSHFDVRGVVFSASPKEDVLKAAEDLTDATGRIAAAKEPYPPIQAWVKEIGRQNAWDELREGLAALEEHQQASAFSEDFRAFAESLPCEGDLGGLLKYVALIGLSWVLPGSSPEEGGGPFNPNCHGKAKTAAGRLGLDLASELDEVRRAAFQGGVLGDRAATYVGLLQTAYSGIKYREEMEARGAEPEDESGSPAAAPNIFWRGRGGWRVASKEIGGDEVVLPNWKGVSYIADLLAQAAAHPENPEIWSTELERLETLRQKTPDFKARFIDTSSGGGSEPDESEGVGTEDASPRAIVVNPHPGDERVPVEVAAEFKSALEDINSELEEAKENNNIGLIEKLQANKEQLQHELRQRFNLRDKPRITGSPLEASRKKVSDCIDRAIESIKPHNGDLHRYFYNKIRKGAACEYTGDIEWDVRF